VVILNIEAKRISVANIIPASAANILKALNKSNGFRSLLVVYEDDDAQVHSFYGGEIDFVMWLNELDRIEAFLNKTPQKQGINALPREDE